VPPGHPLRSLDTQGLRPWHLFSWALARVKSSQTPTWSLPHWIHTIGRWLIPWGNTTHSFQKYPKVVKRHSSRCICPPLIPCTSSSCHRNPTNPNDLWNSSGWITCKENIQHLRHFALAVLGKNSITSQETIVLSQLIQVKLAKYLPA
jgi:hypothetical protein